MKDGIIAGTGNSEYLKSAIPAGTTWEAALEMLRAGTFPIDMNGINPAGFTQIGTMLNAQNVLSDTTATALGLAGDATPNDAFNALQKPRYLPGDSFSCSEIILSGYVTSGTKNLHLDLALPKTTDSVTRAEITSMQGVLRGISGYLNSSSDTVDCVSSYTVTTTIAGGNHLRIYVNNSQVFTNTTNNTPVCFAGSITVTFS